MLWTTRLVDCCFHFVSSFLEFCLIFHFWNISLSPHFGCLLVFVDLLHLLALCSRCLGGPSSAVSLVTWDECFKSIPYESYICLLVGAFISIGMSGDEIDLRADWLLGLAVIIAEMLCRARVTLVGFWCLPNQPFGWVVSGTGSVVLWGSQQLATNVSILVPLGRSSSESQIGWP